MGKIMYGPVLSGGREKLIKHCVQKIEAGIGQFVYLVPTSQLQKEVEEVLVRRVRAGRLTNVGLSGVLALRQPRIYLFDGFVNEMLKDWLAYQKPLRADQQKLILQEVTRSLREAGELPLLHGVAEYEGFYVSLLQWLEEVKGTGETPASWLERAGLTPKERELGLIFARYEEFLTERGLVDTERNYERLIELINLQSEEMKRDMGDQNNDNLPHGSGDVTQESSVFPSKSSLFSQVDLIVIDGFYKLTQLQLRLVKALLGCGKEVIVHTFVEEERSELFISSQEMIEQLQVLAAQVNVALELEAQRALEETGRPEVLTHLCLNLFNLSPRQIPGSGAIEVAYSSDPYQEMEEIGRSIKRTLLADGGQLRLDEFAVILRNVEMYHFYINEVFGELGIPYEISAGGQLARTPIFKLILQLYRVIADNRSRESVLEVLKSHYLNFGDARVIEGYEHLILEAGVIGGHTDWTGKLGRLERRLQRELEACGGVVYTTKMLESPEVAQLLAEEQQLNWNKQMKEDRQLDLSRQLKDNGQLNRQSQNAGVSESSVSDGHGSTPFTSDAVDDTLIGEVEPGKKEPVKIQAKLADLVNLQALLTEFFRRLTELGKSQSLAEHSAALLEFFAAYELDKQVLKTGNHEILRRDLLTLDHLQRLLDEMIRFGAVLEGTECHQDKTRTQQVRKFTAHEFIGHLQESAGVNKLPEPEAKYDAVQILTPSQSRGHRFKRVYIGGLLEGEFPWYGYKDWLFKPEERRALKEQGIHFKQFYEQLEEERLFFLEAVSTATEKLVLTCPVLPGSEDAHSSSFIQEVLNLFEEKTVLCQEAVSRRVRNFAELEQALTRRELDENLLKEMWANPALDEVAALEFIAATEMVAESTSLTRPDTKLSSAAWLKDLYLRGEMVKLREGGTYSEYDGVLQEEEIVGRLRQTYHSNKVYSISQINDYAICPFQFFGKRVLHLEQVEEPTMRLEALDLGNLYHKILFLFFRDFPGWEQEKLEEAQVRMREVANSVMENYVPGLTLPPGLWAIYQEEVLEVLGRILSFEYAEAAKQGYQLRPHMLEASFGLHKDYQEEGARNVSEPVVIQRTLTDGPDGTITVKFHGKIDRIDISSDERYLIIYDYKFGRRDGLDDIEAGVDLQLPIYVKAAQHLCGTEKEVLGAGYFSLLRCERKSGIWRDTREDLIPVTTRNKNCLSTTDWQETLAQADQYVIDYIQRIKAGDFKVNPAKCPEYCKFKKICRFEHARNQRKLRAKEVVSDGN